MFTRSPRFLTLAQQVARILEEDIRRGVRRDTLPGERSLAESLQVSRRTIRAATELLRKKKLVVTTHGAETRILETRPRDSDANALRSIGLLLPEPLEKQQPFATVFINSLRTLFYTNGFRLDTHFGHRYFSGRPSAALKRLVARFSCDGWLLAFSNRASQSWFLAQEIPTVVIGTAHEGIALPFVDVDMLATARHAASLMLRRGHRNIALIIPRSEWPGDQKTEQGFFEGIRQAPDSKAAGQVFKHDGTVPSIRGIVERLLQMTNRPTALFVVNPYHYVTVAAILAGKRLHVPDDVSLLCRDDDYCLRYLPIAPSRYVYSATARAKEIFSTLMSTIQHGREPQEPVKSVLIIPEFFEGASIAGICREP